MSRRPIDISVYTYQPRAGRLSVRVERAMRSAVVASICLLAHGLLLHHLIWTAGAPAVPPKFLPARIKMGIESDQEAMQWIALDPNAVTDPSQEKPELPPAHLSQIDVPKMLMEEAVLVEDMNLPPTPDAAVADA